MMCGSRGNSSVGRARPCQGRGREFESRFPLQFSYRNLGHPRFCFFEATSLSWRVSQTDGQVAEWSCSGLQSRVRRFDSDLGLHPTFRRSFSGVLTSSLRSPTALFMRAARRAKITLRSSSSQFPKLSPCPGGEIGRRKGLKIPRPERAMPVRVRPWAFLTSSWLSAGLRRFLAAQWRVRSGRSGSCGRRARARARTSWSRVCWSAETPCPVDAASCSSCT